MGKKTVAATVRASLSRHNSEQDEADDRAWEALLSRIEELTTEPQYAHLDIQVYPG